MIVAIIPSVVVPSVVKSTAEAPSQKLFQN
jgi:hypothetical protein